MILHTNGVDIFYEKKGEGRPCVLLHGNGQNHSIFDVLVETLSKDHQVYALDSRDHGKSSRTKELSYALMMEDTAELIRKLGLEKPFVYGLSDGGVIALLLASNYPDLVSGIAVSGANLRPDGVKEKIMKIFRFIYFLTRNRKFKMMLTQPNITNEDLARISVPALVIAGSKDIIKENHTRHIARHIPNAELLILQSEGHASYVVRSTKLYGILRPFIDKIENIPPS